MDARCPSCHGPLAAGAHGDLACTAHGHLLGSAMLDATFGLGSAAHAQHLATTGQPVSRRCPQDNAALASVSSAGGGARGEACSRCGALWIPAEVVERLMRTTPVDAATLEEARSVLALAAARAVLTPAGKAPARR